MVQTAEIGRPAGRVADEVLTLNIGGARYALRAWPAPAARQLGRDGWTEVQPSCRLLHPGPPEHPDPAARAALIAFRAALPPALAAAVARYPSHQFNVIELADARPEFLELLASNPVLGWCVANNDQFIRLRARTTTVQAAWQLHRRRRELAGWLGFPATEASVKMLGRILPEAITPLGLRLLRLALGREGDRGVSILAHHARIGAGLLRLLTYRPVAEHAAPQLASRVAADPREIDRCPTADLIADTLELHRRRIHLRNPLPRFMTPEEILRWHDRLLRIPELPPPTPPPPPAKEEPRPRSREFPPPPVPGLKHIEPLLSAEDLRREGRAMHHCAGAASHLADVRGGWAYFYRVRAPQRATLMIRRLARTPGWHVAEMRRFGNAFPDQRTYAEIRRWLAETPATR